MSTYFYPALKIDPSVNSQEILTFSIFWEGRKFLSLNSSSVRYFIYLMFVKLKAGCRVYKFDSLVGLAGQISIISAECIKLT